MNTFIKKQSFHTDRNNEKNKIKEGYLDYTNNNFQHISKLTEVK
jgi:hypothetical protein